VETTGSGSPSSAAVSQVKTSGINRLLFIDNIKVLLTFLVISHHLMVIYAGTGSWPYYTEGRQDIVTNALGGWFNATNQAYFMGLFLLIGAYMLPGSYDRKGPWRSLKDRLIRLGIPLAVYSWIISPIFVYLALFKDKMSFWEFFPAKYFSGGEYIGQGPLWFVETLLIFTIVYIFWRWAVRSKAVKAAVKAPFPKNLTIVLFALVLGIITFLVRIFLIMDTDRIVALNLQLPFFVQYIALFIVGLIAYRNNWFYSLADKTGKIWLIAAGILVVLWAPMMIFNGAIDGGELFKGGLTWQSAVYSLWESFLCLSMCIGLIYAFRRWLNRQNRISALLGPAAYTAYLIHAPIITFLALAGQNIMVYPFLKWVIVVIIAVPLCFVVGGLIRKIPYMDRVL
jgi:glucans biosynthesis protein C